MSDTPFDSPEPLQGIAVVGLAGRFPGAGSVAELWRNLREGVESVSFLTPEELAAAGVDPRLLSDPRYVRAKGVLQGADLFDPASFGFTPREAEWMDPQHRIFLECAWEALEDAGCDPHRYEGRVGVYAGSGPSTYLISNLLPNRELMEKLGVLQLLLLNDRDFLTTRVSHRLGLKGPSMAVQTACSTSLVAVHMACQSLLLGECDLALAGGVSISTPLVNGYVHQEGGVLSPDGRCRAFDASAAGAVEGNGCGVAVLKRLSDALADGDFIHAVIRGSAVTNDGSEKVGFTAPGVEGQAAAISEALLIAGVEPDTIGYVETHGSGTSLGDPIEIEALTQAFRAGTSRTGFCAVGSVKTNLGHCNAAAGIAGFTKAVLAVEHGTIPPSLNFERPNPRIDFAASPFYVCAAPAPWETGGEPRRAGVSSFGLGGTNAHVVLEEAPDVAQGDSPSRPAQLLVLSARTPEALDAVAARLAERLEGDLEIAIADLAWTLQVGRRELEHRRTVVTRGGESAAATLRDPARTASGRSLERPSVVFLFPGLGDQSVDMARELYEAEPVFREQVDLCAHKLEPWLGCDLREVLFSAGPWSPRSSSQGPDLRTLLRRDPRTEDPAAARLRETAFAQPACFVIEYALARLLMDWGAEPRAMIGYSIGEYVAACLSGALSLDDALSLVARRAKLIQELPTGSMLAVPLAEDEVRPLIEGLDGLSIAATNGPHFCVVAGPADAVDGLEKALAADGVSTIRLQTTHAFHSPMMDPAAAALTEMARTVETRAPGIPYLSNVTGTWITERDLADPGYWARHMRGTVRFAEGLGELLREPGRVFVEVGPAGTLATLVKQHPDAPADGIAVPALGRAGESDSESLLAAVGRLWIAGVEIDWARFHNGERRRRVPLPTYPFERQRFWVDPPVAGAAPAWTVPPEPLRTLEIDDWFWVPSWKQVPLVRLRKETEPDGGWLIFLDREGFGDRLAERLRAEGLGVVTVSAGTDFQESGSTFTINPGRRQDYDALVQHLRGRFPQRVLHLWGVTGDEPSFDDAWTAGLLSLVFLEQAITNVEGEGPPIRISMVANGLHDLGDRPVHPGKATLLGAVKVVHQESARLACGSIEIALTPPGSPHEDLLMRQLLAESSGPPGEAFEPVVALRGGRRWVRAFESVPLPGGPLLSRLAEGGVYGIVDDEHGLGVALAGYLLRALGARVALVLPPGSRAGDGLRGDAGTGRLLILSALPEDAEGLRAALGRARAELGPIHGVFHAAGSFAGGLIQLKSPDALRAALGPVARGALALLAAAEAEPEPPEFVVLLSSTFAVTGGLGQLEIAAAGAFLDALALQRSTGEGPFTVAVHWDPYQWDGWLAASATGLLPAEELQKSLEAYRVPAERSGEALRRLLAASLPRAVVSARDLPGLIAETDSVTAETFLAQRSAAHQGPKTQRPGLSTPYVAPRGETEETLAALWQELFGIEPIGVEDSFLELGGHSLLAIQMATQVSKAFGVELPVTALFEAPTIAGLAVEIARLRGDESPEDLEELLALVEALSPEEAAQRLKARPASPPPIANVSGPSGAGDWPLSFDQERLLRLHLENPDLVSWNVDAGSRILGPLDAPALLGAFEAVTRRHAAWRTAFPLVDGRRVQRVFPGLAPDAARIDLTALPEALREAEGHRALFARTRAVFDLENGPLVRVTLARLGEREHLCQITVHHLVTDWITFQVCWREVLALYEAHRGGRPAVLPPLPVQYPDYAVWEREWLQGEVLEEHAAFWRRALEGFPLKLELPGDRPRPPVQSQRGGLYRFKAGAERSDRLRNLARREGATMFMAVLAVLNALLHRFSGQEKLVVGSNSANRPRPELESVFGLFLTQVPFATDLAGDPTFRELLGRVRQAALSAYPHQNFPFSKLLEALWPEPDPSRSPVMQVVLLVLEGHSRLRTADLEFEALPLFDGNSRWDLMFGLYDYPDAGLAGPLEFNLDIFEPATVDRLAVLFCRLMDAVTANPDIRLSQLPVFERTEGVEEALARRVA